MMCQYPLLFRNVVPIIVEFRVQYVLITQTHGILACRLPALRIKRTPLGCRQTRGPLPIHRVDGRVGPGQLPVQVPPVRSRAALALAPETVVAVQLLAPGFDRGRDVCKAVRDLL